MKIPSLTLPQIAETPTTPQDVALTRTMMLGGPFYECCMGTATHSRAPVSPVSHKPYRSSLDPCVSLCLCVCVSPENRKENQMMHGIYILRLITISMMLIWMDESDRRRRRPSPPSSPVLSVMRCGCCWDATGEGHSGIFPFPRWQCPMCIRG